MTLVHSNLGEQHYLLTVYPSCAEVEIPDTQLEPRATQVLLKHVSNYTFSFPSLKEFVGSAKHILCGCKVLLEKGQYSYRHDEVLEIIREAISQSIAQYTSHKFTGASKVPKYKHIPHFMLGAGTDYMMNYILPMMDTREKHFMVPPEIYITLLRPDILI